MPAFRVSHLTSDIRQGKGSIGALLADDKKLYDKLNGEIDTLMTATKRVLATLEKTTTELEATTVKASAVLPTTLSKVDATLDMVKSMVEETKVIVEALQRHWLIKDLVKPKKDDKRASKK